VFEGVWSFANAVAAAGDPSEEGTGRTDAEQIAIDGNGIEKNAGSLPDSV
jgi:hypothetical protein